MQTKKIKPNIKKVTSQKFMERFFAEKIHEYFDNVKLKKLTIKVVRNFLNIHETLALKYTLWLNNHKRVVFRGSATSVDQSPYATYLAFTYLKEEGFSASIPSLFGYDKKLNLLFYRELPGTTIQDLISKRKINQLRSAVKESAQLIKKVHQVKTNGRKLRRYNKAAEEKEKVKEIYLIKKYYNEDQGRFLKIMQAADLKRKKWLDHFYQIENYRLNHGDFHPGNVIVDRHKLKIIDFSAGSFYEPAFDVASFIIQLELMLRYHFPKNYLKIAIPLRKLFLKTYGEKNISRADWFKIKYYEIKHLLQIMSIITFIENKQPYQAKSMEALYEITQKRLEKL